ncbi:hypothetical protein [Geothrix sp. 21YS21S-2]|uniref:hypothetical protein n=1 Tax=Geothrix sp. 21YS21S-2 TaxID=3068893 RepID=UPI0027BA7262|nr:hypothetical protein [Geothrix sp. 21YS21S-2]
MPFPKRKSPRPAKTGLNRAKPRAKPLRRASGLGRARGTTVLHACGHKEKHALSGPKWKKEKDALWQKGQACTACWSMGKAEEQEALCDLPGLPELEGAPRQVSWARSLRAAVIAQVKLEAWRLDQERKRKGLALAAERYLALVLPPVLARTDAGWWIDNREADLLALILDFQTQDDLEALRQETAQAVDCPF